LLVALAWIAFQRRDLLLTAAGQALVEEDPLQHAQAAVVLGGDQFGSRILKAGQLAQAGWVPIVIVSGPMLLDEHESDLTIPFAEHRGFDPSLFRAFPNRADSTRTESVAVGAYLREQHIDKIMLVTSNYHTRRAASLFRTLNPKLQVIAVAAPDPDFDPGSWWTTRAGQKVFLLEWTKTINTKLGG
jgi:uncharacterized SAM-binding protein YcdF (DUF218 family)